MKNRLTTGKCRKNFDVQPAFFYVLFINSILHLGHLILILPLPLGTLIFCEQPGHLNTLCVFLSRILALNPLNLAITLYLYFRYI